MILEDMEDTIIDILETTSRHEDSPPWALGLKLAEECGEFSEAMLKELGFLQHKEDKEGTIGEAADVIIVVLSALATLNPTGKPEDIAGLVHEALVRKMKKYKDILGVPHD